MSPDRLDPQGIYGHGMAGGGGTRAASPAASRSRRRRSALCGAGIAVTGLRLRRRTTSTGRAALRRGEVLNLTVDDIDFAREILYVQAKKETQHTWRWQPKDKDLRALPLVPELSKVLTAILECLPEGQPYLMITPKRYQQIQQLRRMGQLPHRIRKCPDENWSKHFQRILRRSQIKNATFHDLRRTCITEWLENGLQPHEVMQLAGHSSVETTMRYYTATRQTLLAKARLASQKVFGATGLEPATS